MFGYAIFVCTSDIWWIVKEVGETPLNQSYDSLQMGVGGTGSWKSKRIGLVVMHMALSYREG